MFFFQVKTTNMLSWSLISLLGSLEVVEVMYGMLAAIAAYYVMMFAGDAAGLPQIVTMGIQVSASLGRWEQNHAKQPEKQAQPPCDDESADRCTPTGCADMVCSS